MSEKPAVFYLGKHLADIPGDDGWLHETERHTLAGLRFPKRRDDWRLSRWTGKWAVCTFRRLPVQSNYLAEIAILAAGDGAPEVFRHSVRMDLNMTLSHSGGRCLAAVTAAGLAIGCDIEAISPRILTFINDYLTEPEQDSIARTPAEQQALAATLLWCAKESALKVLREGLRRDTRTVEATLPEVKQTALWQPVQVNDLSTGRRFFGSWRVNDDFVETIVAEATATDLIALPEV